MKKILLAAIIFISALSTVYSQCTIANVAITGPTPISICEGTPQILSGTVTVTAVAQNGNFTYSWIKTGTVSVVLVPPTTITIPANVTTTVPSYTGITGALSDAGTYVLRIEDGNAGNTACYAEATVIVNITSKPIITSAETGTICSGVAQNYAITSNVPSSYTWTRATVTGITLTTGSGSTSPITEILTLGAAITHPTAVVYKITPTSTVGSCLGTTFDYTVTVNPTPAITSSATGKICTGAALNYLITSNIPSSYTWTRAVLPTINAGIPGSGSTNTITETLISTASIPEVIRYVITPTSTTGSCEGTPFNYDVSTTAIAIPTVTVASNPGTTICTGTAFTFNANAGNGGIPTYKWTSSVNGVLASTTDSYSSSSLVDGEVIAVEISSSLTCVMPNTATASLTMKVNPNVTPSVTVTADKTSICPGDQVIFTATPVNGGTPTYVWKDGTTIVGGSGSIYTTTDLTPGNSITVTVNSTSTCVTSPTATSTPVSVTVIPEVTPTVSITPSLINICPGQPVTFNATVTNGGSTPSYLWSINAVIITTTSIPNFSTSALTSSSDVVTVELTSNALCAYPKKVTSTGSSVPVATGIGAGTIGSDQTICYNAIPNPITQLTPATGVTTAVVYTWESSTDGVAFTPIPDIGQDITPPALTQTTWYRRTATDPTLPPPCITAKTYSVKITVNPNLVAGTISSDQTICKGDMPETFTNVSPPTGGSGTYKYQWQSDENGTMTNIANATNATFAPTTALTATTHFQRVETTMAGSTTCNTVGSNIVTVTVKIPEEITVTLNNPGQLCAGISYSFEATANTTGTGTLSYKWSIGGITQTSTTSTFVYNPVNSDNGKMLKVEVSTSNSCSTGKGSANAVLTIDPCDGSFSTFISGPNPITPGQQNAVYRVANQTDFSYEWTITGGTIVSGQNTNAVTVDWDAAPGNATGRTALPSYSISVKETNKDKQSKTTTLELNTLTTGVAKSFAQSGINLFPNPTAESFSIDMPESGIAVSYEILDLTGASVAQGNFISTGSAEKIQANAGAGMYQIVLRYNDVVTTGRLNKVQ